MKRFRDWTDADRFGAVLGVSIPVLGFQFLAIWFSNSLTLISDTFHLLLHLVVILIAYASERWATRVPKSKARAGATKINWILLILIALGISFEAGRRWVIQPNIRVDAWLFAGAIVGLIGNVLALLILRQRHQEQITASRRLLWIHMSADAFGSVTTIIVAVAMIWSRWFTLDIIFSLVIAAWIIYNAQKTVPEVFGHEEHP